MWLFERNYHYFQLIFPTIPDMDIGASLLFQDSLKQLRIQCLEISRYTTLLDLQLDFTLCPQVPSLEMKVRLYHDARVADVIAHQDISRLVAPLFAESGDIPENHKKQANLLLHELLSGCIKKQQLHAV